jgi:hypothetical protein
MDSLMIAQGATQCQWQNTAGGARRDVPTSFPSPLGHAAGATLIGR